MPGTLTASSIVAQACQLAKVRNYLTQGGIQLNSVLANLCRNYDFELAKGVYTFNFGSTTPGYTGDFAGAVAANPTIGPYWLPADWLRAAREDIFYVVSGVPYVLINCSNAEFDRFVQQSGLAAFPSYYTTDVALNVPPGGSVGVPSLFVWPPPSGSFAVTARYYKQMPTITTPETSNAIPWFPDEDYLITSTAARLMEYANDPREQVYRDRAKDILAHYLKMKDDMDDRVATVTLDRRLFGPSQRNLPNTKQIGW